MTFFVDEAAFYHCNESGIYFKIIVGDPDVEAVIRNTRKDW